jgi:non-ribosomal peptide synthetase component F
VLSEQLTRQINDYQKMKFITLKAIFLTLFYRMIYAETKQNNVTIGVVTNGRSVKLAKPLTTLGLLWNLAPVSTEYNNDLHEHFKLVNKALSQVSAFGSYPLLNIMADKKEDKLFHAAFNFINFKSANMWPESAGIEMLEIEGIDKFHFPLHLLIGQHPTNGTIYLAMNYDTRYYTKNEIQNKLKTYLTAIETLN